MCLRVVRYGGFKIGCECVSILDAGNIATHMLDVHLPKKCITRCGDADHIDRLTQQIPLYTFQFHVFLLGEKHATNQGQFD